MRAGYFSAVLLGMSLAASGVALDAKAAQPGPQTVSDETADLPHCKVAMAGVNWEPIYMDAQCRVLDPASMSIRPAYVVTTRLRSDTTTEVDPTHCYVEVDGIVWLDASCPVDTSGGPGSWIMNTGPQSVETFVYLATYEGEITGHWNGGTGATHAHSPLGILTRHGACFTNERVKVCIPVEGS